MISLSLSPVQLGSEEVFCGLLEVDLGEARVSLGVLEVRFSTVCLLFYFLDGFF